MKDKRQEIQEAIQELLDRGRVMLAAELAKKSPEAFKEGSKLVPKEAAAEAKAPRWTPKVEAYLKSQRYFPDAYQEWYSEALPVVQQLLPDRYDEFRSLYRVEKRRELTVENYGIAEYLADITVNYLGQPRFNVVAVFGTKFHQQIAMLNSALARLDSVLGDITGVIEASLFDTELEAAKNLLKAKHIRSAGIIAGVVLERHLKRVIKNHEIPFRKTATLANLNEALKSAGVYDVPQWRKIQLLTDIRNLCGHSGEREPQPEEVEDMLRGVSATIRTVF